MALIHKLVNSGSYYFLSRPRRLGQSLLISTLEAYFQGKRELFEGLAMEKLEKNWVKRPVLHLNLNIGRYDTPDSLDKILDNALSQWEAIYSTGIAETTLALRFIGILEHAYKQTGKRVAILIDEYDRPLQQAISNHDLQRKFRNTLKPFYGVLKTIDGCIKFALLTGVTKFGKVKIHDNFKEEIHELAAAQKMTYQEAYQELQSCYDGYHFVENTEGIYNPFSLLNTFKYKKFDNYWFETGIPTYLVELLKNNHYDLERMAHEETDADVLNSIYGNEEPIPVIFQSGYLTIKEYEKEFGLYRLGFPNREVEEGFIKFLIPFYTRFSKIEVPFEIQKFKTTDYIYVMEFKLEGTAEEAIAQIEEKHYARPFETDSRKLFKIGINFSNKTRNIERWIVKNN